LMDEINKAGRKIVRSEKVSSISNVINAAS
jgi:hypothetical protein